MASTLHKFQQKTQHLNLNPFKTREDYAKLPSSNTTHGTPTLTNYQSPSTYNTSQHHQTYPLQTKQNNIYSQDERYERSRPARSTAQLRRVKRADTVSKMFFGTADVVSAGVTLTMVGMMLYMLVKFMQTQNTPSPGRSGPWATDAQLWPTVMVAAAATATFLLSVAGLVVLCCRGDEGNAKVTRRVLSLLNASVNVGGWIAVAVLYRLGRTGSDLWGWSCGDQAAGIQQFYQSQLNFDQMCTIQSVSWILTMVQAASKLLFLGLTYHYGRKANKLRKTTASIAEDSRS